MNLLSGCLSILSFVPPDVSERASRALSIPEALRAVGLAEGAPSSREDRSRPRPGFLAALGFDFALEERDASSAARSASFSAFFRVASALRASASSLRVLVSLEVLAAFSQMGAWHVQVARCQYGGGKGRK